HPHRELARPTALEIHGLCLPASDGLHELNWGVPGDDQCSSVTIWRKRAIPGHMAWGILLDRPRQMARLSPNSHDTGQALMIPPKALLQSLFEAAIGAADPACCVPPNLPEPPSGRTLVIGAGKAAAAMAKAVEGHWKGPIEGL